MVRDSLQTLLTSDTDTGDVVTFRKFGKCESELFGEGHWVASCSIRLLISFDPDVVDDGFAVFEGVNEFEFLPASPTQGARAIFTRVVESAH